MKVTSLSSGSSGNCYLVQHEGINILIDSGLTAAATERHLRSCGVSIQQISAIFLTHDHSDHLRSAGTLSRKWGIPVIANERTLKASRYRWDKEVRTEALKEAQRTGVFAEPRGLYNTEVLPVGGVKSIGGLEVSSVPVSHDAADTVCYTFRAGIQQGMILTDLGCATDPIFEPMYHSDLIVLEANHDLERLYKSNRPQFLKSRIASDHGHLSNKQSAEILCQVIEWSGLNHTVWLAHLSQENNDPKNAVKYIGNCLESRGILKFSLKVALRDKPSLSWNAQDSLFQAQMLFDF
jgi:phosphoribosyl 1,2-cyclic phosphodiesterase